MRRPLPTGTWDDAPPEKVRVLVECPPEHTPDVIAGILERNGYAVRTCEGPDKRHHCPLVTTGSCNLVSGADVVVNLFGGSNPHTSEVLTAITDERRPPAVVTEVPAPEIQRRDDYDNWWFDRGRVHIVESPLTTATLLAAIESTLTTTQRTNRQA
ncbi:MAG: hypothetical protein V9E94_17135 [Microthrixaceae bacterium]|mgnify:CR=1 FL=1